MAEQDHICEVCSNTDFAFALDPTRWDVVGPNGETLHPNEREHAVIHHGSIKTLRISALKGCSICLFFMKVLKQPLELVEPESWGRYEAKDSKKKKKKAKKAFQADRLRDEKLGPCLITALMVDEIHEQLAATQGVVSGFRYGPKDFNMRGVNLGVIPSKNTPRNIGTRNLLHHTDVDLCRHWLQECQSTHSKCPSISESELPTRIIDVGDPHTGAQPRLVESRGQKGLYVTLSHCWGDSRPPATTKANYSSRLSSIPIMSMPKTFRDAIDIVRSLDYHYLWIDSFCIVQDDDADWQRECASMARVYSDCVVTLASPYAKDCHAGFPRGLHPTHAETWCDLPVHWPGTTRPDVIRMLRPYDPYHGRIDWDDSPLAERAWVLQERLLSPRWLYFGKDDLYFECGTAQFDEHLRVPLELSSARVGPYFYTPKDALSFETYGEGLYNWYSMLHTYTHLCLTHGSDRLPALSGIASRFAEKFDDEYIAGLWRKDLVFGLLYIVMVDGPSRCLHPPAVTGPSWSWSSCNRRVQPLISRNKRFTVGPSDGVYDMAQFNDRDCFGPLIEVKSVFATALGENSLGEVRSAKLTIMGKLQNITYKDGLVYSNDDCKILGELSLDGLVNPCQRASTEIFMLPMALTGNWLSDRPQDRHWYALGLAKDLIEPNTYVRIGMINKHETTLPEVPGLKLTSRETWRRLNMRPSQEIYLI